MRLDLNTTKLLPPHIAIISSDRPGRVPAMHGHLGERLAKEAVWYVGKGQAPDYEYAGAKKVVESGALVPSRNAALERAFEMNAVNIQLSDDLTGVDWCIDRKTKHRITLERALGMMFTTLCSFAITRSTNNPPRFARLAGAAATDNAFFMPKDDVSEHAFIIGDMIAVLPNPLRFDEGLHLKEDLDYSIQHMERYGQVLRMNTILANWEHRTNLGGAVQYRTRAGEHEAVDFIQKKWPGWTRPNSNRDNPELLLVYPPLDIATVSPLRQEAEA